MREQGWFDDGDRGAHRPEHAQVRAAIATGVRRWAVVLGVAAVPCGAWVLAGEPPPPGIVDAAGLAALAALVLAWPVTEVLGALAAAGMVVSLRNTALQGPLLLGAAWLMLGLVALGGLRRARLLERRHRVRPTSSGAGAVALSSSLLGAAALVLTALGRDGGAGMDVTCWLAAVAVGAGGAGASADHPGRMAARVGVAVGAVLLCAVALVVVLAYAR